MNNCRASFLRLLATAVNERWCLKHICTTCGCRDFRKALSALPDLEGDLAALDLDELMDCPLWSPAIFHGYLALAPGGRQKVLEAWAVRVGDRRQFVDHVLFYVLDGALFTAPHTRVWLDRGIELAVQNRDYSLTETLVYILQGKLPEHRELYTMALSLSSPSSSVHEALSNVGLQTRVKVLDPAAEQRVIREAERASRNIFGAIRRRDVAAVRSLLKKGPDLTVRNSDGLTALEFAVSCGHAEPRRMIEEYVETPTDE